MPCPTQARRPSELIPAAGDAAVGGYAEGLCRSHVQHVTGEREIEREIERVTELRVTLFGPLTVTAVTPPTPHERGHPLIAVPGQLRR